MRRRKSNVPAAFMEMGAIESASNTPAEMTFQVFRPNADGRGMKREAGERPALPPQR
jgi:hypothetical protein